MCVVQFLVGHQYNAFSSVIASVLRCTAVQTRRRVREPTVLESASSRMIISPQDCSQPRTKQVGKTACVPVALLVTLLFFSDGNAGDFEMQDLSTAEADWDVVKRWLQDAAQQEQYKQCVLDGTLDVMLTALGTLTKQKGFARQSTSTAPRILTCKEVTCMVNVGGFFGCRLLQDATSQPLTSVGSSAQEMKKAGQILEMGQILSATFRGYTAETARKAFDEIDADSNGTIDLDELMTGLRQSAGFSPQELLNLKQRISVLYAEGFELDFDLFRALSSISSCAQDIKRAAQVVEMSQILGRAFKHSDAEDAKKTFKEMDKDSNGLIDLDELMAGLQSAGFTVKELKDLTERLPVLYRDGFELDLDLFVKFVCPHDEEDLGELLLEVKYASQVDGPGHSIIDQLTITMKRGIKMVSMDDGGTSDPYRMHCPLQI